MHAGSRAGMLLGERCVVAAADSCCQTSTAEAFKLSRGCAAHCAKFAPVCDKIMRRWSHIPCYSCAGRVCCLPGIVNLKWALH